MNEWVTTLVCNDFNFKAKKNHFFLLNKIAKFISDMFQYVYDSYDTFTIMYKCELGPFNIYKHLVHCYIVGSAKPTLHASYIFR